MEEDKYPIPEEVKDEFEKAEELRLKGDIEGARRIIEDLIERYPDHPRLWNESAVISFSDVDYKRAEEIWLRTLTYGYRVSKIYSNLSRVYGALGELKKSVTYARRAIRLNPKLSRAWNTLGLYYVNSGELETAVDYFVAACSYDESDLEAAFNAACALCELGEIEDALRYLEKSLKHEFFLNYALKDETLDPLRGHPEFERLIAEATERFGEEPSGHPPAE